MPVRHRPLFFLLVIPCLSPPVSAQTAPRDARALTVMQQSFAAMGGRVPDDSVATGSITIEAGGSLESGTIRILTRGFDQTVEQINNPYLTKTVTYSKGLAKHEEGEKVEEASLELAVSSQSSAVPILVIAAVLADSETAYEYVGEEEIAGAKAHHIRVWKTFSSKPKWQHLAEFSKRDLWVDATSGLPIRLSHEQREAQGAADRFRYDVTCSDFRNVGGVLYPFRIERALNGTPWQTVVIDRVTFGNGLSDSDFSVRKEAQ